MAKQFVSKWVLNSRTGQLEQEIDEIRSAHPYTLASGYYGWADSQVLTQLLSVPSACRFHMKWLWINNDDDANNVIRFYDDASASISAGTVIVAGSTTEFIDIGPGMVFHDLVYASNLTSNIQVRVGGYLVASGPE